MHERDRPSRVPAMSDGFALADTDTSMLSDPKVTRLARRLRDPERTAAALTLYNAVRLGSWREGIRLTVEDALPGWWLDPPADLIAALVAVGLLDKEQRIPETTWERWFGPARDRRQRLRDIGGKGGRRSVETRSTPVEERESEAYAQAHAQPYAQAHAQAHAMFARQGQVQGQGQEQDVDVATTASSPADLPRARARDDPAVVYSDMYGGRFPGPKVIKWLDDLTMKYGAVAVIQHLGMEAKSDPTQATLLGRVSDSLGWDARALDKQERADERKRVAEARRTLPPPRRADDLDAISDDEAKRLVADYFRQSRLPGAQPT